MRIKNKSMLPSLNWLAYAAWFAVVLTAPVNAGAAPNIVAEPQSVPRIDAPVTLANSVLCDFGDGVFLRVPEILIPEKLIVKDRKKPVRLNRFSMVFQYPDMVPSDYQSELGSIVETKSGNWEWSLPVPGRFPVHIKRLFHSSQGVQDDGNLTTQNTSLSPEPRPLAMLERLEEMVSSDAKLHNLPNAKITFTDAKYRGLMAVHVPITDKVYQNQAEKEWRAHGWRGQKVAQYIAKAGSPYQLFMRCDPPDSVQCEAYVYIQSSGIQYSMVFPPSKVEHTDQLIRTIDKMIEGWAKK